MISFWFLIWHSSCAQDPFPSTFQFFLSVSMQYSHNILSHSLGLCIKSPPKMKCLSKWLLASVYRCLWRIRVCQPGLFSSLSPYPELSRLALQQWKHYTLRVCILSLTGSVIPHKFSLTDNTVCPLPISVDVGWGSLCRTETPGP